MRSGGPAPAGGAGYLEHLGPGDLALVLRLAGRPAMEAGEAHALLRGEPGLVEETLASEAAADVLLRGTRTTPSASRS